MSDFNFSEIVKSMQEHGMPIGATPIRFQIPEAKKWLKMGLKYFIEKEGKQPKWLNPYDEVAEWLSDSKGKGLLLYGNVGQGKSVLSRLVLPGIILKFTNKPVTVCNVDEMNANVDALKKKKIISLDDIGTETMINDYGNKRNAFAEIMDNAEKTGQIVIISTNLGKEGLIEKYGDRVFDRILATTQRVLFKGQSLRR